MSEQPSGRNARQAKADEAAETQRRQEKQLERTQAAVARLEIELRAASEKNGQSEAFSNHLSGFCEEVDKLAKGKAHSEATDLIVEHANNIVRDAKDLIEGDIYLDRIKEFVPAGNNPVYPFTPGERERLRAGLLERAAQDSRISGAAITGSAAESREDRWSDVDLAFGVREAGEMQSVLADWTAHMYDCHHALHHLDVNAGAWIYRVFLLPSTLQVDLAFVPAAEFRPLAPTFRLISGEAKESRHIEPPPAAALIGMGWLYALHARSCIARRKFWQAEYMISGLRDNALALACIRHGLPAIHGRGIDLLPREVIARYEDALVRQHDAAELSRSFKVAMDGLLSEIRFADEALAGRLQAALELLVV